MRSFLSSSHCSLFCFILVIDNLLVITFAYKPLSDSFLRNISSGGSDFNPDHGNLLSPLLIPRAIGTVGHATVQHHFINFFNNELPRWTMEWYNSTTTTPNGVELPIANLVFKREPPWTKQGQANWLTLAAHYDSKSFLEGFVGVTDSAVPCAILMHVARSIDRYVTQMHDEMAALGEGGTVEMDMGVQILFLDGKEALDEKGPALYGSRYVFVIFETWICANNCNRALSETWEMRTNPVGSKYPNALSQISIFVLLDILGSINTLIPSYFLLTHWAYKNMASVEDRLRRSIFSSRTRHLRSFRPRTSRF